MDYGADKETKDFARECMIKGEIPGLTGEAIAIIFGAIPITRCNDCKLYDKFNEGEGDAGCGWCDRHDICVHDYFFCADGKPEEGSEEP